MEKTIVSAYYCDNYDRNKVFNVAEYNNESNAATVFNTNINIIPFLLPYPPIFCIINPTITIPNIGPVKHNTI